MDKKLLRSQIEVKIEAALADFAKNTSDKKFKKHIKKAGKILSDGLAIPAAKKDAAEAKPEVKKAKAAPKKATPKAAKKSPAKK